MPVLDPIDDVFRGFNPNAPFEGVLPPAQILGAAGFDPFYAQLRKTVFARRTLENFDLVARFGTSRIATTIGLPEVVLGSLGDVFKIAPFDDAAAVEAMMKGLVAKGAAIVWDQALEQVTSEAPIVGTVVKIAAVFIVKIIDLIRSYREMPKDELPPPEAAIAYDKDSDDFVTDELLRRFRSIDKTPLFMPPVEGQSVLLADVASTAYGRDGLRLRVEGDSADGYGAVPGAAAAFSGMWQARYAAGGARILGSQNFGDLNPALVQAGTLAWQTVLKPGRAMFQVDAEACQEAWIRMFTALDAFRVTGEHAGALKHPKTGKILLMDEVLYAPMHFRKLFPPGSPWRETQKLGPVTRYRWVTFIVGQLQQNLIARRRRALRTTVTCAYVKLEGEMDVAFRNRPALRDYALTMRKALLRHLDRWKVDQSLIVDPEYAAAMRMATRTIEPNLRLPGAPTPTLDPRKIAMIPLEPIEPGKDEPTADDVPGIPGFVPGPSGAAVAGMAVGGLGLGWILWRLLLR